jgi:hypothetical protein
MREELKVALRIEVPRMLAGLALAVIMHLLIRGVRA